MNKRSVTYNRYVCVPLLAIAFTLCGHTVLRADKLTLAEGIRIVTEDNRVIKIAQQEESMSRADTLIARSRLLPRVDASYTQNYQEVQPGVIINTLSAPTAERSFNTYSLTIQQLLYDFGGASSYFESSKRIFEAKQLETKRTRNYVALQFASTYYGLLESEKMVKVAEREQQRLEAHRANARALYKEGTITKNDLLQAEVRLSDARQKLITAQSLKKIRHSQLNNLLARALTTPIETEEANMVLMGKIDLENTQEAAEKNRYEMTIVDSTLEAVKLEETGKRSEYFPKFFVQGQYDYMKNKYQIHEGIWGIFFGMNINLSSGGSTQAGLAKIASQKQRLITERKKLADDIRFEVERYYLELVDAQEKVKVTKDAIAQAEENLRINKVKYADGVGTATDVIDAITLLSVAETNYYRSLYEFNRAYAGLMYASGKDLTDVYRQ
jgi:outer membrane protein